MTHKFEEKVKLRPVSIDGNFGETLPKGSVYGIVNNHIDKIRFTYMLELGTLEQDKVLERHLQCLPERFYLYPPWKISVT